MKTLILAQTGGLCPPTLLNLIASKAIPFLYGKREPIKFKYPECEGLVKTRGVYTSLNSFFGLIVSAEVEHQESRCRIDVKMILRPNLTESDVLIEPDFESNLPSPVWVKPIDQNYPSIEGLEVSALN